MKNFKAFLESMNSDIELTLETYFKYENDLAPLLVYVKQHDKNLDEGISFMKSHYADYGSDDFSRNIIDSVLDKLRNLINTRFSRLWSEITDKGYSGNKTVGKKYRDTKNMPLKEIADLIKNELKIEFPTWKFSVRSDRNAISVSIVYIDYNPFNEEADEAFKKGEEYQPKYDPFNKRLLYNDRFTTDYAKISKIYEQYNMDDTDGQSDYFHTRYYGSVSVDDTSIISIYYPSHPSVLKKIQYKETEKARLQTKKENTPTLRKSGELVTYNLLTPIVLNLGVNGIITIPIGRYDGVITKGSNGMGHNPYIIVDYTVPSGIDANGKEYVFKSPKIYIKKISLREVDKYITKR